MVKRKQGRLVKDLTALKTCQRQEYKSDSEEEVVSGIHYPSWLSHLKEVQSYKINRLQIYNMIQYFLKLEWRNILRNKYLSLLKISGLVIGIVVFLIAGYYALLESNYDCFQKQKQNKYELYTKQFFLNEDMKFNLAYPFTNSLQQRYPEIVKSTSFDNFTNPIFIERDNKFIKTKETNIAFVDNNFFDVFQYEFIDGNTKDFLTCPNPVIITQKDASLYFGAENAINKTITIRLGDKTYEFIVKGIIKNVPDNSNVNFHWIGKLSNLMKVTGNTNYTSDPNYTCTCYIQIKPTANITDLTHNLSTDYTAFKGIDESLSVYATQLTKVHLDDNTILKRIRIFITLGFIILIISIVNYILLSTIEKIQKMKNEGIDRISGARQSHLVLKNTISLLLISIISFSIAVSLFYALKPNLLHFFGFHSPTQLNITSVFFMLFASIFLVIFITLIINTFFHIKYNPVDILKNKFSKGTTGKLIFNTLLVFQLIALTGLISSSLIIHKQMDFIQKGDLGFQKESLISMKIDPKDIKSYTIFKNELLKEPEIVNIGASSAPPFCGHLEIYGNVTVDSLGNKLFTMIEHINVDKDFFQTMGIKMKIGTDFPLSSNKYCITNSTFIKEQKLNNPIGEKVQLGGNKYEICGILNDYHQQNMHQKIPSLVAYLNPGNIQYAVIRYMGNPHRVLNKLEEITQKTLPNTIFEYEFMDETIKEKYLSDLHFSSIIGICTFLSILIAILGLLGVSYYSSLLRRKEIGIRKVNGANLFEILVLLNKNYTKWVFLSFIIASPIVWFLLQKWLEDFAYRISISWWFFIPAVLLALAITVITVTIQCWKTAIKNPTESLSYE